MGTALTVIPRPKLLPKSDNPYRVLGVKRCATLPQIVAAYKKLAHKLHPDRGGDAEEFKRLQAAYDILRHPARRWQYDTDGFAATAPNDPSLIGAAQDMVAAALDAFFGAIEQTFFEGKDDPFDQKRFFLALRRNDPVQVLGLKFDQDIVRIKKELKGIRRVHRNLRKWNRVVQHKDEGASLYDRVYQKRLKECVSKLQSGIEELHLNRAARKLLKGYVFTTDVGKINKKLQRMDEQHGKRASPMYSWVVSTSR